MEFQVFIHGEDVVENVLGDARNDTHLVSVVQLALKQEVTDKGKKWMVMVIKGQRLMEDSMMLGSKRENAILAEPQRVNEK